MLLMLFVLHLSPFLCHFAYICITPFRDVTVTVLTPHRSSQVPRYRLFTVTRLLKALMLWMVIGILPNLLTAWYSALYCPSNHSDINANVIKNLIKHFMRAHEKTVMASVKKRRSPSAFYMLGLQYLFLNFPNIKHIGYLYNRNIAYLAGMKMNHGKSIDLHVFFPPAPVSRQVQDNGPC